VQQARLRVETLRWMAGKMSPDYDDKTGASVQIASTGQLFLQAVARPGAVPPPRPAPREIVVEPEPEPLPATTAEKVRAENERRAREAERRAQVDDLMRGGLSLIEAEQAVTQWNHEHPAKPLPRLVKPPEEELE
jgi:hypothetical protein